MRRISDHAIGRIKERWNHVKLYIISRALAQFEDTGNNLNMIIIDNEHPVVFAVKGGQVTTVYPHPLQMVRDRVEYLHENQRLSDELNEANKEINRLNQKLKMKDQKLRKTYR